MQRRQALAAGRRDAGAKRCEAWREPDHRASGMRSRRGSISPTRAMSAALPGLARGVWRMRWPTRSPAACAGYGSRRAPARRLSRRAPRPAECRQVEPAQCAGAAGRGDRHAGGRARRATFWRSALDLGGYPVVFLDTAGLREADSAAEREGVRRAAQAAGDADLVLWLDDLSDAPSAPQADAGSGPGWPSATKADLVNGTLTVNAGFIGSHRRRALTSLLSTIRERAADTGRRMRASSSGNVSRRVLESRVGDAEADSWCGPGGDRCGAAAVGGRCHRPADRPDRRRGRARSDLLANSASANSFT